MHKKRVANASAANQSQNEKDRMDLAVIRLFETVLRHRFAHCAEFKHVQDDQGYVDGEARTREQNAQNAPA